MKLFRMFGQSLIAIVLLLLTQGNTPNKSPLQPLAIGEMIKFSVHDTPKELPAIAVKDPSGQDIQLAAYKDKILLVNFWATWCGPCRTEMPHLEALQKALGGKDFQVILISQDLSGLGAASAFLKKIKITGLKTHHDPKRRLGRALDIKGLPVTLLIGRDGHELGRLNGPADWQSEDAKALIRHAINF